MMVSNVLVSVIIPVYNGERYLGEAIESVLAQTYRPLEVIVVDDGSTDGSRSIAERYCRQSPNEVRAILQENAGQGSAMNRGSRAARGAFHAYLDADDLWLEDKLQRQVEALLTHPDYDMATGQVEQFISPDLDEAMKARIICPEHSMPGYIPSAIIMRRDAYARVGPFDENRRIEFMIWYLRAMEAKLQMLVLPEAFVKRRLHDTNQSLTIPDLNAARLQVLKASLDRRRRMGLLEKSKVASE